MQSAVIQSLRTLVLYPDTEREMQFVPLQDGVASVTPRGGELHVYIHDRKLDTALELIGSFAVSGLSRQALREAFTSGDLNGVPQTFEVAKILPKGNVGQLFAATERCTISEFRERLVSELGPSQVRSGSAHLVWASS